MEPCRPPGPALTQAGIALKFLPPYSPQPKDIERTLRTCLHEGLPQRAFTDRTDLAGGFNQAFETVHNRLFKPISTQATCLVQKSEGKGSDVILAIDLLVDTQVHKNCDNASIVTNESDFAYPKSIVAQSPINVILVNPSIAKKSAKGPEHNPASPPCVAEEQTSKEKPTT